jgi:hypothetical protein
MWWAIKNVDTVGNPFLRVSEHGVATVDIYSATQFDSGEEATRVMCELILKGLLSDKPDTYRVVQLELREVRTVEQLALDWPNQITDYIKRSKRGKT